NLHTALKYLRHASQDRTLWADAICINQNDIEERNAQVARMADIYKSAAKVIVWLGPEADGSIKAMKALDSLASIIKVEWAHYTITQAGAGDPDPDWLDLGQKPPYDDETWTSLVCLLNRPWFGRLWIWQEVFLAQDRAELFCGCDGLRWQDFRKAILLLWRKRKPSKYPGLRRTFSRAWEICNMSDEPSLRVVLRRTKDANCSDPRDRIFGILHLVSESERLRMQPDYSKTTLDVYRDMIVRSVFEDRDLSLLTCCEYDGKPTNIPSWVPNWSKPRKSTEIWFPRACWNSMAQARYTEGGPLIVTGCYAATVREVVPIPILDREQYSGEEVPELEETYAALRKLCSVIRGDALMNLDQQAEALCRTLCCNSFADRYEPINRNWLDFQKVMERFPRLIDPASEAPRDFLIESAEFLDAFYVSALERAVVLTKQGYIGLVPERCQPNDVIVVILGCQSPMVLRPTNEGHYHVVGECFVHGMMTGEILLGPLPKHWQRVSRSAEGTGWDAFIDRERGVWQVEDPRLCPLPDGWVEEDHPMQHVYARFRNKLEGWASIYDPRMMPAFLRKRGLDLQDFNLV
ncbi:MAG: hypothetical protein Q9218_008117, partial [Villophora microphyllina]